MSTTCGRDRRRGTALLRHAALLLVVALATGCGSLLPVPAEAPSLHLLDARGTAAPAATSSGHVVDVAEPRAWPGFDTAQIAYVQRPHALDYFARHQWVDTPARMLRPLLAHALERSGGFAAVVQSPASLPVDLRITSELIRLQQDFTVRPSRVELAWRIAIYDVRAKRVVAARTFEASEPAATDDPAGGVAAANAALARMLDEIVAFSAAQARSVEVTPAAAGAPARTPSSSTRSSP